ncbi:lytic transglycosylase domain-containing protein [Inquilinus limosus]|uniref:lytic transglycosylase domain-containing protein n=1 Tax=Inquilinus limosus TaxID=171674 RepID=UPI001EE73A32|nr:lytic transglycosylase domain-containing protein [Inquilinus limosus]
MRGFGRIAALAIVLFGLAAAPAPARAQESCTPYILAMEGAFGIPRGMLLAIAQTESGGKGDPYPWALNVGGTPMFPSSLAAMKAAIEDNGGGESPNIDVGCMQISLRYHKQTLPDYTLIFQPQYNVIYGAYFLRRLFNKYGNWLQAIAHYHSSDPDRQFAYACRVLERLKKIRGQGVEPIEVCASG